MTASDPRVGEIQALVEVLQRAHRMSCSDPSDPMRKTTYGQSADALAYLLAELRKATRAAQTLGQVIEKQCRDVLDVTGLHHLINEDGDGHWDVVWMRLFEMREELAGLKESTIGRERLRGDSWRDRAQEMELSRDAAANELRDRDEKLAKVEAVADRAEVTEESGYTGPKGSLSDWEQGFNDGKAAVAEALRAAVAAANGGGE